MKKLYLIARNHMDPSWLRCFKNAFPDKRTGQTVRPYADIEEMQILEYMDFAERYGVKYQIEQSLVVKHFLERNPDQKERFAKLAAEGYLELAGGGEAVIDYNLPQGESWVRNHLYSRAYYLREFGHRPKYAITPDIFGLPSQLPQFFRSVGYDALIIFDRVLKNNKPFWRGLDGTPIVLDSCFLQPPEPNLRTADCVKLPPCGVCGGEGCALCEGTGVDHTYDMTRPDKRLLQSAYYGNMSAETFLDTLLKTEKDEYFAMITTEEPRIGGFLYGPLKDAAAKRGIELHYLGFEENHEVWCHGQEDALRSGDFTPDQIDTRPEGNPAACGCYTSRIEIKKANRELEQLLFEAENLCVLTRMQGGWDPAALPRRDYPAKKLEALWNKMAFIQFHDCITGSHCDASYDELMNVIREVRRGAYQICHDAVLEWSRAHGAQAPEGYWAAVYFNPTPSPVMLPSLALRVPEDVRTVEITDAEGRSLQAFDFCYTPALVGGNLRFRVRSETPAFGWRVFYWRPAAAEAAVRTAAEKQKYTLENECFRVTSDARTVLEVFDKRSGRAVLGRGACCLAAGTDIGNPWGRSEPERDHRLLYADSVKQIDSDTFSKLVLSGAEADPATGGEVLRWEQTLTLYPGEPLLRIHTALDWGGRDTRVFATFPAAFASDENIYCEVPFGTMARRMPAPDNLMGILDEWPSLGYAGLSDGAQSFAVLKGGLPGTRLHGNALQISLLRAFSTDEPKYAGGCDHGLHAADYALYAWEGGFAEGDVCRASAGFAQRGTTLQLTGPGIWNDPACTAPATGAGADTMLRAFYDFPAGLRMSALKWAEDGSGPVVRFWEALGRPALLQTANGYRLLRCDSLEQPEAEKAADSYTLRPFEIATFRLLLPGTNK